MAVQKRARKPRAGESPNAEHFTYRVKWRLDGTRDGAWQSVTVGHTKGHGKLAEALDAVLREKYGYSLPSHDPRIAEFLGKPTETIEGEDDADADRPTPTVRELVEAWASRPKLGPSSRRTFGSVVPKLGDLGELPAAAVTKRHVNAWFVALDKTSKPSTQRMRLTVLKGALKPHVAAGVFDDVAYPDEREVDGTRHLSDAQVADLLAHASPGTGMRLPVWFVAETGVRYGEMAGLVAADVDLERGRVWIGKQVRQADDRKATGFVRQPTKGKRGRNVSIPPELCEALALVRELEPHEPVFRTVVGGYWSYHEWLRAWRRLCKATPSVPDTTNPHDLRHSAAIRMLGRGLPLGVVKDQLGHASIGITDAYYGRFADDAAHDAIVAARLRLDPTG